MDHSTQEYIISTSKYSIKIGSDFWTMKNYELTECKHVEFQKTPKTVQTMNTIKNV